MICKIYKNDSIGATLEYNFKNASELIGTENLVGEEIKDIEYQMVDTQKLYNGRGRKNVAHIILSPAISDGLKITQDLWKTLAQDFIREAKFEEHECAYFLHKDKEHYHLHIVVNKIDLNGKMYHTHDEWAMAHKIADDLATKYNLLSAKDIQKEYSKLRENDIIPGIKGRVSLKQDCINAALESMYNNDKFNIEFFFKYLEGKGYEIKRFHKNDTGLLHGYGIKYLDENHNEVFYKSSEIGRDFTLANIGKTALKLHKQKERQNVNQYWEEQKSLLKKRLKATGTEPIKHYDFKNKKVTLVPASVRNKFIRDCPIDYYESPQQWENYIKGKGYQIDLNHALMRYSVTTRDGYTLNANEIGKEYSLGQLERNKKKIQTRDIQSSTKANYEMDKIINKMDTTEDNEFSI